MIAAEYEAIQRYMQLAESTDNKLARGRERKARTMIFRVLLDMADAMGYHEHNPIS